MKVKHLILELAKLDPELEVVQPGDDERLWPCQGHMVTMTAEKTYAGVLYASHEGAKCTESSQLVKVAVLR